VVRPLPVETGLTECDHGLTPTVAHCAVAEGRAEVAIARARLGEVLPRLGLARWG
jgi:hypothetical protein